MIAIQGAYATDTYASQKAIMHMYATEDWDASGQGFEWFFTTTANNTTSNTVRLTIPNDGGIDINGSTEPTCDSTTRGRIVFTESGASTADTMRVCAKNSSDTYSWYSMATIP